MYDRMPRQAPHGRVSFELGRSWAFCWPTRSRAEGSSSPRRLLPGGVVCCQRRSAAGGGAATTQAVRRLKASGMPAGAGPSWGRGPSSRSLGGRSGETQPRLAGTDEWAGWACLPCIIVFTGRGIRSAVVLRNGSLPRPRMQRLGSAGLPSPLWVRLELLDRSGSMLWLTASHG
jgi:hypothetical protein